MNKDLEKKMMELAEAYEFNEQHEPFKAGFQAAIPLIRAECEEEIKELKGMYKELEEILDAFTELRLKEKSKSAKLLEAAKDAVLFSGESYRDDLSEAIKEYEASK